MNRTGKMLPLWVGVTIATVVGVFILPLYFPPSIPTDSISYTVGYNNKLAAVVTALISVVVTLVLWRRGTATNSGEDSAVRSEPMPRWWLGLAATVVIVYTAVAGGLVVRADVFYPDASYFFTQVGRGLNDHGKLYLDFDFAYGPLLYYWPELFAKVLGWVGMSLEGAYMVSLAAMQALGLGVVFYILGKLPLSRGVRALALAGALP